MRQAHNARKRLATRPTGDVMNLLAQAPSLTGCEFGCEPFCKGCVSTQQ